MPNYIGGQGSIVTLSWSPDSKSIEFTSNTSKAGLINHIFFELLECDPLIGLLPGRYVWQITRFLSQILSVCTHICHKSRVLITLKKLNNL
jgi:hypothetical protein